MILSPTTIEACARAAHEANRAFCIAIGDDSHPHWEHAPEWHHRSLRVGVMGAISGATPEQLHQSWMAEKLAAGWCWGPTKDPVAKRHPDLLPYGSLPAEQKAKEAIFWDVVRAVARSLGVQVVGS